MACETLTAASTRNVNNTAKESHWKTTRNRGETFCLFFIIAIVLRVRLGSGRPPGPHAGVVVGVNCLADDIELTMKAITKANKRAIGEIIRKYCKTLWAVSKMSEGSVISDDTSESDATIAPATDSLSYPVQVVVVAQRSVQFHVTQPTLINPRLWVTLGSDSRGLRTDGAKMSVSTSCDRRLRLVLE